MKFFLPYHQNACDIFLMASPKDGQYRISDNSHLYLYKEKDETDEKVKIFYMLENKGEQYIGDEEKPFESLSRAFFGSSEVKPNSYNNKEVVDQVLGITSNRGHTYKDKNNASQRADIQRFALQLSKGGAKIEFQELGIVIKTENTPLLVKNVSVRGERGLALYYGEKVLAITRGQDSHDPDYSVQLRKEGCDALPAKLNNAEDIALKMKIMLLDLLDNVLTLTGNRNKEGEKYEWLRFLEDKIKNTTFKNINEVTVAAQSFLMLALQRDKFGFKRTTRSGKAIRRLLNMPQYDDLRSLFSDKSPVKYRDLVRCTGAEIGFFSSASKNKRDMYQFYSENSRDPFDAQKIQQFLTKKKK